MYSKMEIARLLREFSDGNQSVVDAILPLINDELRHRVLLQLIPENEKHILNVLDLVNEAYLNLVKEDYRLNASHRAIFLSFAARAIRLILVNYLTKSQAENQSGLQPRITLNDTELASEISTEKFLQMNNVLEKLSDRNEQQGKITELWLFGGLEINEIAELVKMPNEVVDTEWRAARNWIDSKMKSE